MAIDVLCGCGKQFRVKDEFAGKRLKCPACGQGVTIPGQEVTAPEELLPEETGMEMPAPASRSSAEPRRGSRQVLILVAALVLVAVAAGGYFLLVGTPPGPGEGGKVAPARIPSKRSHGSFDFVDSTHATGWARDPAQPDDPVSVDIFDNDKLVATVLADQFRQDLVKLGGSGKYRFLYHIPPALRDGQEHVIRARISGTSIELKNSPKTVTLEASKKGKE